MWALIIREQFLFSTASFLMNFSAGSPSELEESAKLDGASQWQILWRIFIPISKAVSGNDHFVQPDQITGIPGLTA